MSAVDERGAPHLKDTLHRGRFDLRDERFAAGG